MEPQTSDKISTHKVPHCPSRDVRKLHEACEDGNLGKVKRLAEKGVVDVDCRGAEKMTAVMVAASVGNKKVFDYLIHLTPKSDLSFLDENGYNVVHNACYGGSTAIVRRLLTDYKMDIECRTRRGNTPLMVAAYVGYMPIVKLLKKRGADIKAVNYFNDTILHLACKGGYVQMVNYVQKLKIWNIERRGGLGRTPIMCAVAYGKMEVVQFLYHKAYLTLLDEEGQNVFHLACHISDLKMVKYLVTLPELKGLERKKDNNGKTPELLTVKNKQRRILAVLKSRN